MCTDRPLHGSLVVLWLAAACAGSGSPGADGDCPLARYPPARAPTGGWTPLTVPSGTVQRLVEAAATIEVGATALEHQETVFDSSALAQWRSRFGSDGVGATSPTLAPADQARTSLTVVVRPGGASSLAVTPRGTRPWTSPLGQSPFRRRELPIPASTAPDRPLTLTLDLSAVLLENWEDSALPAGLDSLELELLGADPETAAFEQVRLGSESARYRSAASVAPASHGGVVHPSWAVHGGTTVRIAVDVPTDRPSLRWRVAATEPGTELTIRVDSSGDSYTLAQIVAGAGWQSRSEPLDRWAGQSVSLALSAEGGVALFGDPTVVSDVGEPRGTDVVVYLVDTLLASRLGFWGSPAAGVSPTIDRLAEQGATLGAAMSTSPWTKPAIPTLLTGLYPTTHRVGAHSYTDRLPSGVAMLQHRFRAAGYRTGSFSASPLGSVLSGLEPGFDTVQLPSSWTPARPGMPHPAASQLNESLGGWIDEQPDRPFLAYLHSLEVHEYRREPFQAARVSDWEPYDNAIHDQDQALAELLELLAERERDVLLVLLSDHGEELGGQGRTVGHGFHLYQSQLHVPLVFWSPTHLPASTVADPVSLADVPTTLLALAGLDPLPDQQGVDLSPFLRGEPGASRPPVPSDRLWFVWDPDGPQWHSLVSRDLVKAMIRSDGERWAFEVGTDACERADLAAEQGGALDALDAHLAAQARAADRFSQLHGKAAAGVIDADQADLLRELGYLE